MSGLLLRGSGDDGDIVEKRGVYQRGRDHRDSISVLLICLNRKKIGSGKSDRREVRRGWVLSRNK